VCCTQTDLAVRAEVAALFETVTEPETHRSVQPIVLGANGSHIRRKSPTNTQIAKRDELPQIRNTETLPAGAARTTRCWWRAARSGRTPWTTTAGTLRAPSPSRTSSRIRSWPPLPCANFPEAPGLLLRHADGNYTHIGARARGGARTPSVWCMWVGGLP